jgi:hypothetical protein
MVADVHGVTECGDGGGIFHSKSFDGKNLHVWALSNDEMSSLTGNLTEVCLTVHYGSGTFLFL